MGSRIRDYEGVVVSLEDAAGDVVATGLAFQELCAGPAESPQNGALFVTSTALGGTWQLPDLRPGH